MAEIKITALKTSSEPSMHGAAIGQHEWPNGSYVSTLRLFIGPEVIEIWPADKKAIEELGKELIKIASEL